MDPRERLDDPQEAVRMLVEGMLRGVWTALPGIVESYDPDRLTCTVQPSIRAVWSKADRTSELVDLPLLLDCPVIFPGGGGATMTFPIAAGDECLVVFSSRCLDAWWQSGGVQPPLEDRMHDLSDGFVFVGPFSQPQRPADVSATTVQIRSIDGSTVIELDPGGQTLALTAPGGTTINANTTINGTLHVTGKITTDDDVQAGSISLKNHKHGTVQVGSGQSGVPV